MDPITTLDHAITLVRRLREISKNVAESEFKNVLADLANQLADAKLEIAALKEQLATAREELRAVQTAAAPREKPTVKWGCYQFPDDEGLYCTACYDTKGAKNRTTRLNANYRRCPVCQALLGS